MPRLYLRIYLAMLAALALFAVVAAAAWSLLASDEGPWRDRALISAVGARLMLPATTPMADVQADLIRWRDLTGFDFVVYDAAGQLIAATIPPTAAANLVARDLGRSTDRSRSSGGVYAVELPDGRRIAALAPWRDRPLVRRLGWLVGLLGIAAAVGLCAYPVVRRLTRRLEHLEAGVGRLGAGDLAARVPVEGHDEVARLATTFNRSAERIENLIQANRSLLAYASHELRSPLARLRLRTEQLTHAASAADRTAIAQDFQDLDQLVDEILTASRLDARGADALSCEPLDLTGLAAEIAARHHIEIDAPAGAITLTGDPRLLQRLISNLIDNARRHGGRGPIDITVDRDGSMALLRVADRGPGVPVADRERVFAPFYRLAGASEADGGVGLGLALVRQIADRHGGSAIVTDHAGGGACFEIRLPLTSPTTSDQA